MADIPVISCASCVFFTLDSEAGEWGCSNPDNPDRERVDDYGIFDCEYSEKVELEGIQEP